MELAPQCSNLAPGLLHVVAVQKGIRQRTCPTKSNERTPQSRPPGPVPRLTELMLGAAQCRYEDGEIVRVIVGDLGVSRPRLSARLRERGVLLRRVSPTDEQVREMCRRYEQGDSLVTVSARIGFDSGTVHKPLLLARVTMRTPHEWEQ